MEGQTCSVCDHSFGATGGPSPAIPNNANGITVCITANRTSAINFNNAQNVTVCIPTGVTVNANFNSLSSVSQINNLGNFTARADYNGNWTINNSGTLTLNFASLNSNKVINNSGSFVRTGDFTVNGTFNSTGTSTISGSMTVNSGSQVNNSGSISVGGNYQNNGQTNSTDGSISVSGTLTNNGGGVFSIGVGSIGGNVQNNGNINIHGSLNIQGDIQMNGGSNISAGDNDQPNYLFVIGNLTGAGCLNGNNGILFTNKFQTSGGNCRNGEVYIGTGSGCLEIIDLPAFESGGEGFFERVYIFRCSTGWVIPGPNDDEEPLDEAQLLIVAGGGGGGRGTSAGGGGAGGVIYIPSELLPFGTVVPVIVGGGGAGSTNTNARGSDGGLSSFLGLTVDGGGGGGSTNSGLRTGNSGGSGGGGAASNDIRNDSNPGGSALGGSIENISPGLGSNGGTGNRAGNSNNRGGGGGGGSVTAGDDGSGNNGGDGGRGIVRDITGMSITYAAGGGGIGNGSNGLGGIGVPGDATTRSGGNANGSGASRNGLADTGSGGGATSSGTAGNGSNGIVIVRQTFKILPVEYLYFEANFRREERLAEIKWATGKEWENSHFELQRSMGNVKNWEAIEKIEGLGWSDTPVEYSYKDKSLPLVGGIVYYRLKQVDFNGDSHLSKVIAIRIPSQQVTNHVWRVFPNPNSGDQFTLDLVDRSEYSGEDLRIRLISPTSGNYFFEGSDFRRISEQIREQLQKSSNGIYILEVSWGKKIEYIKVLRKSSLGSIK
ncbi:hypothetical protein SAMN00777080_0340 [Aquiflexum balticum DSM 16537]|uniref:Glycine-rich domain-containing protein n=1 Tax=Aquiflexum balticum DSM 16537 TaxID=758820 RepID=A0A1W2GYW6_9BACT|nr:hypothetical protein [Aquiflexum balticum]SMD41809.1 hypothetical protein SAMN00777080_0340 [Aquiflexum balticum DSM 16537]